MADLDPTPSDTILPPDEVETIAPGITCEWLDDQQIVVFTLATVARTSIDALLNQVKTLLFNWPADRPYLALYVLADSTTGPTPYIRERFRNIPQWRPELDAHIAFVTARNLQGRLIQLFIQSRGNAVRMFFNREDGIAWLRGFRRSPSGHE